MKTFKIEIATGVAKDIKKLRFSKPQIAKLQQKIMEIAKNPKPKTDGGYGEPLSLKDQKDIYLKFRFQNDYRVVYTLVKEDHVMKVLIIGLRKDKEVYKDFLKRCPSP